MRERFVGAPFYTSPLTFPLYFYSRDVVRSGLSNGNTVGTAVTNSDGSEPVSATNTGESCLVTNPPHSPPSLGDERADIFRPVATAAAGNRADGGRTGKNGGFAAKNSGDGNHYHGGGGGKRRNRVSDLDAASAAGKVCRNGSNGGAFRVRYHSLKCQRNGGGVAHHSAVGGGSIDDGGGVFRDSAASERHCGDQLCYVGEHRADHRKDSYYTASYIMYVFDTLIGYIGPQNFLMGPSNPQSTYFPKDETGLVCLPTQLERTLQLYW